MRVTIWALTLSMAAIWNPAAQAGYEWYHHNVDMSYYLYVCMDTCFHTDNTGAYEVTKDYEDSNILLRTLNLETTLEQTCYDAHTVPFSASVSVTQSLAVAASDSNGGTLTFNAGGAWDIGEAAKSHVQTSIGYSKSWDWTVTGTHTNTITITGGVSKSWPQSGERKVTGPAKVSCPLSVYGNRAQFTLKAKRQHFCTTTIKHTVYTNDQGQHICNSWIEGDIVYTTYSGHGDVRYSGTSSGENPLTVSLGEIVEEGGPILENCSL